MLIRTVLLSSGMENVLPEPCWKLCSHPGSLSSPGLYTYDSWHLAFCSILQAWWICEVAKEVLWFLQLEASRLPWWYPHHSLGVFLRWGTISWAIVKDIQTVHPIGLVICRLLVCFEPCKCTCQEAMADSFPKGWGRALLLGPSVVLCFTNFYSLSFPFPTSFGDNTHSLFLFLIFFLFMFDSCYKSLKV